MLSTMNQQIYDLAVQAEIIKNISFTRVQRTQTNSEDNTDILNIGQCLSNKA